LTRFPSQAFPVPPSRFHGWIVAAAAAAVLLVRLGGPALMDDDEPKNAACSLAMLESGDWVVPTFNGRLRIEKPPLVNWIQLAGFTVCGRNETGARIGSAVLTIGSCLLTWRLGCLLSGPAVGLCGGLVMATCVWTAVGGRAATPDAPLVFCTTLALCIFARGTRGGHAALSPASAAGVGLACGAATLAKGPIGLLLPLAAFLLWAIWRPAPHGGAPSGWMVSAWHRLRCARPLAMLAVAAAVAMPWYAWVTLRTDGEWLRGFLLVHNVGRFAAPMEGHTGSLLYYPTVLAVGLFPWSIVLAAVVAHAVAILRRPGADDRLQAMRLLAAWAVAWVGALTCAGTKLPGYAWPVYPAFAVATAQLLVDWTRGRIACVDRFPDPRQAAERLMRLAWCVLAVGGLALAAGLPLAAARLAPDAAWLGLVGLVPLVTAAVAWQRQSAGMRDGAIVATAVGSCLTVTALAAFGPEAVSRPHGPRELVARLEEPPQAWRWACLWNTPPSLVFYTGSRIERLDDAAGVAAHLRNHPESRVVIDVRQQGLVTPLLPPGCDVLDRITTLSGHDYLLLGRRTAAATAIVTAAPVH
jgi:4-amino-4-deoxy-L-arabinose transferase-like glycosyltransferase